MKRLVLMVAMVAALGGCNTISGVGMDIRNSANRVAGWLGG
jgi:predicted small secreted protein